MAAQLKEGGEKKDAEEEPTGQEEAPSTPATHSSSPPPGGAPEGNGMAAVSITDLLALKPAGRKQMTPTSSVATKAAPTSAAPKSSAGGPSGADSGVSEEKGQKGLEQEFKSEAQEPPAAKMREQMEGQKGAHSASPARAKAGGGDEEERASEDDTEGEEQEDAEAEDGRGKGRVKKAGRKSPTSLSSKAAGATPEAKGKVKGTAKTPPCTAGNAPHPSCVLYYTITSASMQTHQAMIL
jgi:hypothetical protein